MRILAQFIFGINSSTDVSRQSLRPEYLQGCELVKEPTIAKIVFYKSNQEFFFPVTDILFFETEGEKVCAHTNNDSYYIKYRLYELENILPAFFVRGAKSTIINASKVYSIERNLTSSSIVKFNSTYKHVYVSRNYYNDLKQKINELREF